MKVHHFLSQVEHERIHRAIQSAESHSAARLIVYISHKKVTEPLKAAEKAFHQIAWELGADRTALLFFLAPEARKFAVFGGSALHEKLGQEWWNELAGVVTLHFKAGNYTQGLTSAIDQAGKDLSLHFPASGAQRSSGTDLIED